MSDISIGTDNMVELVINTLAIYRRKGFNCVV